MFVNTMVQSGMRLSTRDRPTTLASSIFPSVYLYFYTHHIGGGGGGGGGGSEWTKKRLKWLDDVKEWERRKLSRYGTK